MIKNLLFFLLPFFSSLAFAEARQYDVEIIIFEDTTAQYINSERWPSLISEKNTNEIDESSNSFENEEPIYITNVESKKSPSAEYPADNQVADIIDLPLSQLNEELEKLNKSKHYNVLLHKAWRQTGLDKNNVIDIPIDTTSSPTASDENMLTEINVLNQKEEGHSYLKGSIKVELARYLHAYTNLIYSKPETQVSPLNVHTNKLWEYKHYLFKDHRKLRSNELHYMDHSLIGMLIKIIPSEKDN